MCTFGKYNKLAFEGRNFIAKTTKGREANKLPVYTVVRKGRAKKDTSKAMYVKKTNNEPFAGITAFGRPANPKIHSLLENVYQKSVFLSL